MYWSKLAHTWVLKLRLWTLAGQSLVSRRRQWELAKQYLPLVLFPPEPLQYRAGTQPLTSGASQRGCVRRATLIVSSLHFKRLVKPKSPILTCTIPHPRNEYDVTTNAHTHTHTHTYTHATCRAWTPYSPCATAQTYPAVLCDEQVGAAQVAVHVAARVKVHHARRHVVQHIQATLPGQVVDVLRKRNGRQHGR